MVVVSLQHYVWRRIHVMLQFQDPAVAHVVDVLFVQPQGLCNRIDDLLSQAR